MTQVYDTEPLIKKEEPIGLEESNFLYTNITPLIELINRKSDQIQNSELAYFMEKSLDPQKALMLVEKLQKEEVERMLRDPAKAQLLGKNISPTFYLFRKLLWKKLLEIGILNFSQKGIEIGAVYLLDLVTDAIKDYDHNDRSTIGKPVLFLTLMTVVYLCGSYVTSRMNIADTQFLAKMRMISQYLIYQKALRTKYLQETVQKKDDSKKDGDEEHVANVNNLLTVDIEELQGIRWAVFEFFSSIMMIALVIYFLYTKIGNAMIAGLIFFVIAIIINAVVSSFTIYFYRKALVHKDNRIGLTTDVIEGMKQLKYLSWEATFNAKILEHRKKEFTMITCQKSVDTLNNVYWTSISYILLYIFLTSYVGNDESKLQETNIFTIIALFNLLTMPMGVLPYCVNQIINLYVSYGRIKKFLDLEEINEEEVIKSINCEFALDIPDMTFRWPVKNHQAQQEAIDNDNYVFQLKVNQLQIQKNSLSMIIGRIGCGKTALLNAILNEMDSFREGIKPKITVSGSVAYVSQNHWLQNMSIKENILFGKAYNQEKYLKCISACELVFDLNSFPNKDQYILGPDAKNISGGQKQRISLCRALYQDSDIYLMDDIFSSLDMHVADQVFIRAIVEMLLDKGKTVLMVTSQFRFIEMSQKAQIIFIENGQIQNDQSRINDFLSQEKQKEEKEAKEEDPEKLEELKKKDSMAPEVLLEPSEKVQEDEEEREIGEIAFDSVKYYMSKMTWGFIISFLIFSITLILSRNLVDFWLRSRITDDDQFEFLDEMFGNSFHSVFASLIGINVGITILASGLLTTCTLLSGWRIFKQLNDAVMNSKMSFFDKNGQGRIINRLSNDTLIVDDELPWFAGILVQSLLSCIGYPMGIIILFPWMSIIVVIELFLFNQLQKKFRKSNRDLKRIQSTNDGKIISHLTESTSGLRIIRSFEKQRVFLDQYISKLRETICSFVNANKCQFWLAVRLQLLSNLIFVSVSISIIFLMLIGSEVNYATCAMTLTYAVLIANSFNDTMTWFTQTEGKMVSVERIRQYFNNPQETEYTYIDQAITSKIKLQVKDQSRNVSQEELNAHAIIFNDVTLTYDDVNDQSKPVKYALKNFSISIKKGEKIAFVGRTGSGKTSILNILFRLYDYQLGEIYVEGKNIQKLPLHQVRTMLSVVPQFGFLYNATLRDNIDPLHVLQDEEITQAFNQTGFKIRGIMEATENKNTNSEVDALNINNDTETETNIKFMIAKSGSNLSNGEKQVINFMRIILQNKQIVCLDEATSNMDPKTDEELHKTLFDFAVGRTLLVITHRLENIAQFDRIVVLEEGQIAEIGTYDHLMDQKGLFFKLVTQKKL